LTLALKGDRKAQGNWGEIILEDILQRAGLVQGQHFRVQEGVKSDDGQSRVIPDVVVDLPNDRHIVVDSKFTLPDYRAFANAQDDTQRAAALDRHLVAIRAHMKGLCDKEYQKLHGLNSLDFVVMFIPLEPAFMLAVTNDCDLFYDAWNKNVLLVSPSTLLFVIRTIAYLWRQEDLRRNAKDISRRGAGRSVDGDFEFSGPTVGGSSPSARVFQFFSLSTGCGETTHPAVQQRRRMSSPAPL
jgi:DNA recombination protein RmuC